MRQEAPRRPPFPGLKLKTEDRELLRREAREPDRRRRSRRVFVTDVTAKMDVGALAVGGAVDLLGVEAVDAAGLEAEADRRAGRRQGLARGRRWRGKAELTASLPRIVSRSGSRRARPAGLSWLAETLRMSGRAGEAGLRAEDGEGRLAVDGGEFRLGPAEVDAVEHATRRPPGLRPRRSPSEASPLGP